MSNQPPFSPSSIRSFQYPKFFVSWKLHFVNCSNPRSPTLTRPGPGGDRRQETWTSPGFWCVINVAFKRKLQSIVIAGNPAEVTEKIQALTLDYILCDKFTLLRDLKYTSTKVNSFKNESDKWIINRVSTKNTGCPKKKCPLVGKWQ